MKVHESQSMEEVNFQQNFNRLTQKTIEICRRKEEKRQEFLKEQRQEQEKERAYQQWKESHFPDTLEDAKNIFNWVSRYLRQPKAVEIFAYAQDKRLFLFSARYFHRKPGNFGSGASLYMTQQGILEYREYFKWMRNCGNSCDLENAEQMAKELNPDYVSEACEQIRTGKVWDRIISSIDNWNKIG